MAKVKVFHAYTNADNNNNNADNNNAADDDTRVMAIPRLFFFEKRKSLKLSKQTH